MKTKKVTPNNFEGVLANAKTDAKIKNYRTIFENVKSENEYPPTQLKERDGMKVKYKSFLFG